MLGHSEGGIIAPMVASKSSDVKFMVLLAAPGTKGIEIVLDQNENSLKHQGIEPETINRLQLTNREIFESLLLVWLRNDRTSASRQLSIYGEQLPI